MDRSDVITLLSSVISVDDYGVERMTRTSRDVYVQVDSVTRSEFFEGGRAGLNPEFKFTMFAADYEGERELIYNNLTYTIYRTYYGRNDNLELYAERKGGSNGKDST